MAAVKSTTINPTSRGEPRRKVSAHHRRHVAWGWFFISPWIIGFLLFQLVPMLSTVFLSFTDYSATKEFTFENFNFVGLTNYAHLFDDPNLLSSMGVTLKFAAIAIPLGLIVPLIFALLVNSKYLFATNIFRTLFFLPTVIPVVAAVMVFQGVLNAQSGWINLLIKAVFGIDGPRWLSDPAWVIPGLNLLGVWGVGNSMLILLASLQGVPTELYEASIVDGANPIQRFFNITIPLISPVIFYNVTIGLIGSFSYFTQAILIGGRNGDPQGSTLFFALHFYRQAFVFNDMGYASVLALVLFVIVMALTGVLFGVGQRLVYYSAGD